MNVLIDKILEGYRISKEEAFELMNCDLYLLSKGADKIRNHFMGNGFDLCCIINGKSGKCSEDCKYCAQSAHYKTDADIYPLLDSETIVSDALEKHNKGVQRYSIVTSGKKIQGKDLESLYKTYRKLKNDVGIFLCASHGLLDYEQLIGLKNSGVRRYHNNLESSRNYFEKICSTHTYDEKIETIKSAKKAGLEVCSGGIIGMGETMEDRIDLALELRKLEVDSVPINVLNPIKGTPLENIELISHEEIIRTVAIFRYINPSIYIRLAGGRGIMRDKGKGAFLAGANGTITGDMLTTSGITVKSDIETIEKLGFRINQL